VTELWQILTPQGELAPDASAPVSEEEVRRLYRAMVGARIYDRKGSALQLQGRLATYAPFEGQEAAQIGSAFALRPADWMVATYRDAAAMWFHGYPWELLLLWRMGDERGNCPPEGVPILPPSITVGAHMLHAVGLAWAARLRGENRVALTTFGDGATSEGDFHEAMNFAAVFRTPTVFVCQNNQYAISLRRDQQSAAATIASKAEGYGMPGAYVDGNDLFAMIGATRDAVDRARRGDGPTLIEAVTYRLGPHTTSDDPGRYRDPAEEEEWRPRDPIERVRRYLERAGAWSPEWQEEIEAEETAAVEAAVEAAEALAPQAPDELFESMFAVPTRPLVDQRAALLADAPAVEG
jgi:2-oxoisovalerate dehydrogenase E1 component alpha subunit